MNALYIMQPWKTHDLRGSKRLIESEMLICLWNLIPIHAKDFYYTNDNNMTRNSSETCKMLYFILICIKFVCSYLVKENVSKFVILLHTFEPAFQFALHFWMDLLQFRKWVNAANILFFCFVLFYKVLVPNIIFVIRY